MKTLPEHLKLNDTMLATPELIRFLLYSPFQRMKLKEQ
jgi:hypothetical protein